MSTSAFPLDYHSLPVAQRLELVAEIWDSIVDDQAQIALTDGKKDDLDRRLAAPDRGASWKDVKSRLPGE
jgi:putative addiction module component (TIGR02574 family)